MNSQAQSNAVEIEPFVERVAYECCPLCGSSDMAQNYVADCSRYPHWRPPLSPKMVWMVCNECGHSFTNGYYTEQALACLFSQTHPNQNPGDNLENNRAVSAAIVDKVQHFCDRGRWLDVGFGNGSLLFTAAEYGYEPFGVDLRQTAVEAINEFGIPAQKLDICDAGDIGPFDVISMADVLEHMPFPRRALEAVSKLLSPKGVLFISAPNAGSVLWDQLTKSHANPYWIEMEHYHNFSRERLTKLLYENGFDQVRYGVSQRYRCGMELIATRAVV